MYLKNQDAAVKHPVKGVILKVLSRGGNLMMTEVSFEKGVSLPEHAHYHEQISYIVKGCMEFSINGEQKILYPGDSMYIEGNIPHSVTALEESIVVDAFTPQREDFK
ncbi:MAG: cupin domain-containing protein [Bacillota bacterium]